MKTSIKKIILLIIFFFSLPTFSLPRLPELPAFSPDRVLVAFQPGTSAAEMGIAHKQLGAKVVKTIKNIGIDVVAVPSGSVLEKIELYKKHPKVKFAEPNYHRYFPVTNEGTELFPSLPPVTIDNFSEQWHLDNIGQSFSIATDFLGNLIYPGYTGFNNADIDAPEGWTVTHGIPGVKIAILDGGISCAHVDLDSKCLEQVSMVGTKTTSVDDLIGHGTHVAGIAAAETDNNIGTAGVAWEPSFGSIKVCYEDLSLAFFGIILGVCDDADIALGIDYAVANGYHVISMSLAGPSFSATLDTAVTKAWNNGLVIVAGAGNDYLTEKRYPAAFTNVIAVGATDQYDNQAFFSSFSDNADDWVSVSAPGHIIFSSIPGNFCGLADSDPEGCYDWKSGTSMATPIVAGVAAMLISHYPSKSNTEIRDIIQNSADTVGALGQNLLAWTAFGRVNLHNALTYSSAPVPATTMHVNSILVSTQNVGQGNKKARADVYIVDDNGNPVIDASVSGIFSGDDYNETINDAITDSTGKAVLLTTTTQKGGIAFMFCVDDVTVTDSSLIYQAADDVVSCPSL